MRLSLELVLSEKGYLQINFWDWAHGNDIVGQVLGDKILVDEEWDEEGRTIRQSELTLSEFMARVKESVDKQRI